MGHSGTRKHLKQLECKKNTLFAMLQTLFNLSKNLDDDISKEKFKTLIFSLNRTREELLHIIDEIIMRNIELNNDYVPDYDIVRLINEMSCSIEAAENKIKSDESKFKPENFSENLTKSKSGTPRLPKIELPHFSGDLKDWESFYSIFNTLINENNTIPKVDKMYYLMGCLRGQAKSIASGLPLTGDNYDIIWKGLLDRFQDIRSLGNVYLSQILEFRAIRDESEKSLNLFLEKFDASVRALKNLNLGDLSDFILVNQALSKLDSESVRAFELNRMSSSVPTYEEVINFIKLRVKTLASGRQLNSIKYRDCDHSKLKGSKLFFVSKNNENIPVSSMECPYCGESGHFLGRCETFKNLSPLERYNRVKENSWCYNCLSIKHGVKHCPSTNRCFSCGMKHHSLLHEARNESKEKNLESEKPVHTLIAQSKAPGDFILLGTAVVYILNDFGIVGSGRFLVDNGSQVNLITIETCKRLGLQLFKFKSSIQGLGGISRPVKGTVSFSILSKHNKHYKYDVTALVVDNITGKLPQTGLNAKGFKCLENLPLADPKFGTPSDIHGVLGADIFATILGNHHIKQVNGTPTAIETSLGYLITGKIKRTILNETFNSFITLAEGEPVENLVKKFWELEEVPEFKSAIPEEKECEELFLESVERDSEGRFTVALPFKFSPKVLGDSVVMAKKRFFALENKLNKNENLKIEYCKAITDFVNQGHFVPVKNDPFEFPNYFIPHHAVLKPESSSTPVRIVLDASAPTDNNFSLNSILYGGPKLQTDICSLIINFRLFKIGISSDIRQMYRQINVVDNHRKYQRLFWRENINDNLQVWEQTTLAFGVKASPYLALRTVKQLLIEDGKEFPLASNLVEKFLYMDDFVVSVSTEAEALQLYEESCKLFERGKFELTKWASNSETLISKIPQNKRLGREVHFKSDTKILGLLWDPKRDVLLVQFPTPNYKCTKRNILSAIARCYDPIGIVAPFTLYLKMLVKQLWVLNVGWDEEAPTDISDKWNSIVSEWKYLADFKADRYCGAVENKKSEILAFSDASQDGYGAVIYLRTIKNDKPVLRLLCAKSKVSPVKITSIPRLELCACLLLSKLTKFVTENLNGRLKISKLWAFSDSTVVLQWLRSDTVKEPFVHNRIEKIKENVPSAIWRHISGKRNPADALSRGMTPKQLISSNVWLNGPSWGYLLESQWPCTTIGDEISEPCISNLVIRSNIDSETHPLIKLLERRSNWMFILRTTVRVLSFLKIIKLSENVSVNDLHKAELCLVKLVQHSHFETEIKLLESNKPISTSLKYLRPFLQEGLLRVGGRLTHSILSYEQQHPLILPKKSFLTYRIIDFYHEDNFHTGSYLLEALIRQKYWILGGKSVIKTRIRNCNKCFRFRPKNLQPLMGNLPEFRVNQAKVFLKTGVDYFGPVNITMGKKRGATVHKAYVALFICMCVKALHLELVSSLSTDHFLQAFKRFLARRGPCQYLFSDRGTNFVGAKGVLSDLDNLLKSKEFNEKIGIELTNKGVEWKLNPPSAPHMGGIWESNIKSVKIHLMRVLGDQLLTYEEMSTLLAQIECLMNSRPLCTLSTDPDAPEALTPSHFLTLTPLKSLPAANVLEFNPNRLNRFQLLDQMVQGFWKRWQLEYLTSLQNRQKWSRESPTLKVGTVVLIKTENVPPLTWPLGVISGVHPGRDGIVRVVTVKCGKRDILRPVVKVCPLPTQ